MSIGSLSGDLGVLTLVAITFVIILQYGSTREIHLTKQRKILKEVYARSKEFISNDKTPQEARQLLIDVTSKSIDLQIMKYVFIGSIRPNKNDFLQNCKFIEKYNIAKNKLEKGDLKELEDIVDDFIIAVSYSSVIFGYLYRNYVLPYHKYGQWGSAKAAKAGMIPAGMIWIGWISKFGSKRTIEPRGRHRPISLPNALHEA